MTNSIMILDFGNIRVTEDDKFSVYDIIRVIGGKKNPWDCWKRLCDEYSELLASCEEYKFPGRGGAARTTPVTDSEGAFYIIGLLPGAVGHAYRERAAKEMCRLYGKKYKDVIREIAALPPSDENKPTPKELTELFTMLFDASSFDENIKLGFIANVVSEAHPEYKKYLGRFKELLPKPIESELVTVTELAKLYRATGKQLTTNDTDRGNARRVNELLIEQGFQIKNPAKEQDSSQPSYLPTEKGQEFSELIFQQGEGSQKTIQQLRWHKGIVDVLS